MGAFFGKEELENLKSLKHDLVDPVKSFSKDVYRDTVGDAGSFYADKVRKAQRSVKLTQEKTKARMAAIRREQEEMKKRRNATVKRAAIILAVFALFAFAVVSAALSAHAAEQDTLGLGNACLSQNPPDYENAAAYYKRAGMNGNPEPEKTEDAAAQIEAFGRHSVKGHGATESEQTVNGTRFTPKEYKA